MFFPGDPDAFFSIFIRIILDWKEDLLEIFHRWESLRFFAFYYVFFLKQKNFKEENKLLLLKIIKIKTILKITP